MTILQGDIALLASEVMDDVAEGGGMATGNVIVDGASNNVFADISELDRTYGRINIRKVFASVLTDNTDLYGGSHVIVAAPPADKKVAVSLFTTGSWTDRRAAAKDQLESYLAMSAASPWTLYGNHLAGQRTLQLFCRAGVAAPDIDSVVVLVKASDANTYQYCRVSRLISRSVNVEFEDNNGTYYRDIITVEISDALRYAFTAPTMQRYTSDWYNPPTKILSTVAADAARYYGITALKTAAALGDLSLRASSIYTQIVPSALSETAITDARCAGDTVVIVPITGAAPLSLSVSVSAGAGESVTRYFGSPFSRGSLQVVVGGVTLTDDGNGSLNAAGGFYGLADYETGAFTLARSTAMASLGVVATAQPAAAVAQAGNTDSTAITVSNRGYTYVKSLYPTPAPGTVRASYMAGGKWYSLQDNGAGALSGDDGVGVGTINYATGATALTLGALPDADTQILYSWGTPAHYEPHIGTAALTLPSIKQVISGGALQAGSVSIKYLAGGVQKTISDNSAGSFSGDGSGYIDYANGVLVARPSLLPDSNTDMILSYRQGGVVNESFAAGGGTLSFTLGHTPMPGAVSVSFVDASGGKYTLTDDGQGVLVLRSVDLTGAVVEVSSGGQSVKTKSVALASAAGVSGTINYGTGAVNLSATVQLTVSVKSYARGVGEWLSESHTVTPAGLIRASYRVAGDTAGEVQVHTTPMPPLVVDVVPTVANTMVPGSWRIRLGGIDYVDRSGSLVKAVSATTNAGTVAGTINYATGQLTLTDWVGGGSSALTAIGLTRRGEWSDYRLRFRTSGAPLQVASLYLSAVRADTGALVSATGGSDGVISGALVDGKVDYTTGIVSVQIGQRVAVSTLTQADLDSWWYDPANVVGGQIVKPTLILPETAKYNAVATSSLPLSADILGLDPVRLPTDGRVPMFRKADVAVVHHTHTGAPQVVSNGQTVNVGRERVAVIRVVGANGATITGGYTTDLDEGTVTFINVTGYAQPVTIEDRIEDMVLVTDVQINGQLSITPALTHDFPVGSYISSALVIGDMHARISTWFDQATWQNAWSDSLSGNAAVGTYNKTQFPPVVTNRGAIQERWAIVFTSTTTVNVIGESVGQILTGFSITDDLAPTNPAQSIPYFSIRKEGWGQGWAAGNVLRFNTIAANYPVYVVRTILQGPATATNDKFTLGVRGDINA